MVMATCIALIPARSGSKRIAGKNIKPLAGHPLIAYTIAAARQSGVFSAIVVSTDSEEYGGVARWYGAEVPFFRPVALAGDNSADIEWVEYTLTGLAATGRQYDCCAILRPTSPFRSAAAIRSAWEAFNANQPADSLRAVELCRTHPGKMWVLRDGHLLPLLPLGDPVPWHSSQYVCLPTIYAQTASLEIAWTRTVTNLHSIAGSVVAPFIVRGYGGFDINTPEDWEYAEWLAETGRAKLPVVDCAPIA